jgi:hypothetical protein
MKTIDYRSMPHHAKPTPICDFCGSPQVKWRYPTRMPDANYVSPAGWEACDKCSELIEEGNYPALALRNPKMNGIEDIEAAVDVALILMQCHLRFKESRLGPRQLA